MHPDFAAKQRTLWAALQGATVEHVQGLSLEEADTQWEDTYGPHDLLCDVVLRLKDGSLATLCAQMDEEGNGPGVLSFAIQEVPKRQFDGREGEPTNWEHHLLGIPAGETL